MAEVTVNEEEDRYKNTFLKGPGLSHTQADRLKAVSCESLKSDRSMPQPPAFSRDPGPPLLVNRQKAVSCESLKSDRSMPQPPAFSPHPGPPLLADRQKAVSLKSDWSMIQPPAFSPHPRPPLLADRADKWTAASCVSLRSDSSMPQPPAFSPQPGPTFRESPGPDLSSSGAVLLTDPVSTNLYSDYKRSLEQRCEFVSEGAETESRTPLKSIYADLYMVECASEDVSVQHEETQLETLSKRTGHDELIKCHEVFKPLPSDQNPVRTVLTMGVAGVGKTISVLKFCLDWAQGSKNQELELVLPLSFRELNLVREQRYSLLTLIHAFHPSLRELTAPTLSHSKILFICDGLDETRLPLDFHCELISEVTKKSEVSKLLVNLIKGTLLPDALIWITSRPAAASRIPVCHVHRLTEVRGFTDEQRTQYFAKRFTDSAQCERALSHIQTSRSLRIMSQIPVFCWIIATVLQHMFISDQSGSLPQTLTDLYASFLLVQTQRKRKYRQESSGPELSSTDCELLLKLGRLAFEHLEKGNIMFYQEDLQRVGLEETDTLVNSGLCTKIFKREDVSFNKSVYCFIHLSIQEFLAALYKFHRFKNKNRFAKLLRLNSTLDEYLKKCLAKSFNSPSGHRDLFVRFLHGLMLESNQTLLRALLGPSHIDSKITQRVISNLKKMNTKASPDRSINILHCLTELNDHSVHQQIKALLESGGGKSKEKLSEIQCSALAYMLQISEEVLEELNLQKYKTSAEGHLRLVPAVRNCRKAVLSQVGLSKPHFEIVASALKANPSLLRELDLTKNQQVHSLISVLCTGLASPNCRLEILRLNSCGLSEVSCSALASALKSNPSHLRELDVRSNWDLKDSGVERLCSFLQSPNCRVETLRLSYCRLTESSCSSLASALNSNNSSHLTFLDVGWNKDLKDSGVERLCAFLQSPHCRLETLRLNWCDVSEPGCSALALARPSHLTYLDLGGNDQLKDGAVEKLCGFLQSPDCRLETIRLNSCGVSKSGCCSLAAALRSNPSHLKEINLWYNFLNDSDLKALYDLTQSPHYRLDTVLR